MLTDRTIKALRGITKATTQGCRVRKLHKIMRTHHDLWFQAYANIYSNRGAITKGVNEVTLDGFGGERVTALISSINDGTYRPSPVRRTYILKDPKKPYGKKRPLGIPTGNDKLVQEVVRMILEEIYEPIFSDLSHGFRPNKSCHTALEQIVENWKGTKWICDVDIKGYFDNIDHSMLINFLEKRIDDPKFLGVIQQFLEAGYLEDWKLNVTYSGTPQGGIISPLLANIYLHELDMFMEDMILAFNKGHRRRAHKPYHRLTNKISGRKKALRELPDGSPKATRLEHEIVQMQIERDGMPSLDMHDENFRRLHYVRYADDFLIGVTGSKEDAIQIMDTVRTFVEKDLHLSISEEKSSLSSFEKGTTFLGYGVKTRRGTKKMKCVVGHRADGSRVHATKRTISSHIHLFVPKSKIRSFVQTKGYGTYDSGKTDIRARVYLNNYSDYEIVSRFNAELRGLANYYCLAPEHYLSRLEWMNHISLFKTLGRKYDLSWSKIARRMRVKPGHFSLEYVVNGETRHLPVFRLRYRAKQRPRNPDYLPNLFKYGGRTEILDRLSAKECEYCTGKDGPFEIHHIRKLSDIRKGAQPWEKLMIARQRKTLILCRSCHINLHRGTLPDSRHVHMHLQNGEPDA